MASGERRWGVDRRESPTGWSSYPTRPTPARGAGARRPRSMRCGACSEQRRRPGGDRQHEGLHRPRHGRGVEDVLAVKALETGIVPPVPNHREPDPDLGSSTCRRAAPTRSVRAATRRRVRLADQHDAAALVPPLDGRRPEPDQLGFDVAIADPVDLAGVAVRRQRLDAPDDRDRAAHAARPRRRPARAWPPVPGRPVARAGADADRGRRRPRRRSPRPWLSPAPPEPAPSSCAGRSAVG